MGCMHQTCADHPPDIPGRRVGIRNVCRQSWGWWEFGSTGGTEGDTGSGEPRWSESQRGWAHLGRGWGQGWARLGCGRGWEWVHLGRDPGKQRGQLLPQQLDSLCRRPAATLSRFEAIVSSRVIWEGGKDYGRENNCRGCVGCFLQQNKCRLTAAPHLESFLKWTKGKGRGKTRLMQIPFSLLQSHDHKRKSIWKWRLPYRIASSPPGVVFQSFNNSLDTWHQFNW